MSSRLHTYPESLAPFRWQVDKAAKTSHVRCILWEAPVLDSDLGRWDILPTDPNKILLQSEPPWTNRGQLTILADDLPLDH